MLILPFAPEDCEASSFEEASLPYPPIRRATTSTSVATTLEARQGHGCKRGWIESSAQGQTAGDHIRPHDPVRSVS